MRRRWFTRWWMGTRREHSVLRFPTGTAQAASAADSDGVEASTTHKKEHRYSPCTGDGLRCGAAPDVKLRVVDFHLPCR